MTGKRPALAERILGKLTALVVTKPSLLVWPQWLLILIFPVITFLNLGFNTSRNDLVGDEKKYHQIYLKFLNEFESPEDLVVIVQSENFEKNREYIERLAQRVQSETNLFQRTYYKGNLASLGNKALFFLDNPTLEKLDSTLEQYNPFLEQFGSATNLQSLFSGINVLFSRASSSDNNKNRELIDAIPALERIIARAQEAMNRPGNPPSPGVEALFGNSEAASQSQYLTFDHGRVVLLTTQPAPETRLKPVINRLRELAELTRLEVSGVNAGVTGEPVLEFDEMQQAQKDMIQASLISFILVAVVFIFGYHETGRPLKASLGLVVGLVYTMGYTTLSIGHLNILTITFAPILIGLAIDLGIHLVSRFEEEISAGVSKETAITISMVETGKGIFSGALTTSGAFFAMALTDFDGIKEMGIITGGGMLLCLVPMMTLLPVMLLKGKQICIDTNTARKKPFRYHVEQVWLSHPGKILGLCAAVTIFSAFMIPRVTFDYNLLHLQTDGISSVALEKKLISSASKSILYCASIADDADEAIRRKEQFSKLESVASVDMLAEILNRDPAEGLDLRSAIVEKARQLTWLPVDSAPINLKDLKLELWALTGFLKLALNQVDANESPQIHSSLNSFVNTLQVFRESLNTDGNPERFDQLKKFEVALLSDIRNMFGNLAAQDITQGLTPSDLPPALKSRLIGKTGKYLLQVFPNSDIWERENQEKFVTDLRSIDPDVTGTPVQLFEYTSLLVQSYLDAGKFAIIAIIILALIHFRSIIAVILALLPVLMGSLWTTAWMIFNDIPFNPANIMTLPLVIGIGVTNAIHILNRYAEEGKIEFLSLSTGKAVLVSGLTTIAGFASLTLAKHQGIASLGMVMSFGVAACMIAALAFLPAALHFLQKAGWRLGRHSQ